MELYIKRYHNNNDELLTHIKNDNNDFGISLSSPPPSQNDPFDLYTNLLSISDFINKIYQMGCNQIPLEIIEEDIFIESKENPEDENEEMLVPR